MRNAFSVCLGALVLVLGSATRADAQIYEAVGTRAQGMGAFVAVADDASATWWNPAGLATGKLFSLVLDHGKTNDPARPGDAGPGRRDVSTGFAIAFPALGVSYYQFRISEIAPVVSTDSAAASPPNPLTAEVRLRALSVSQFAATVGQSVGGHLVIGSTFKLLKAGRAESITARGSDLLDRTADLEVAGDTKTDLDVGAMAAFGPVRAGLNVKHLRAPEFGEDALRFAMKRQARAGVALLARGGPIDAMTVAADLDLTRTDTVNGDVRHLATGIEMWFAKRHLGIRSGVSVNTTGARNTTGSAGVSLGGPSGLFLDAALLFGSDRARNGLSLGMSMTF